MVREESSPGQLCHGSGSRVNKLTKPFSRYATTGWAPNIARMPEDRRMATLVAFAYAYTTATLDDALDVFDMLIADIAASAKTLGQKKRLRSLRDLDEAALALAEVCSIVLDDARPDDEVRTVVLSRSGPTPEGAPTSRVRVDAGDSSAQRRHWAGRRTVSHAARACCMALCIA